MRFHFPIQTTLALLTTVLLSSSALAQTSQFQGLGYIGSGGTTPASSAYAVSSDGSIVIGQSTNASNQTEAFRWAGGTMQGLGFIGGGGVAPASSAYALSADGSVIVGQSTNASSRTEAFRWTGGTMQGLGFIGGGGATPNSYAYAVSADGSVVVGQSTNASDRLEAFRWSGSTMQGLGFIGGGGSVPYGYAYAVSADGSIVFGQSSNASDQPEAFRWSGGVMQGLGFIGGGGVTPNSSANASSADGSVAVGRSTNASNQDEAFRWSGGVMQGLGFIGGGGAAPDSSAYALSADGSVVVGQSTNAASQNVAFRWSGTLGTQAISTLLAANGVSVGTWTLRSATGISADGTVIVGNGIDPSGRNQAWLVRYAEPVPAPPPSPTPSPSPVPTPVPPAGFLTMAELGASLNDMRHVVVQAQSSIVSTLDDQKFIAFNQCPTQSDRRYCLFATGTGNFWSGGQVGGHGTAGFAVQPLPGFHIGADVHAGRDRFDLRLSGRNDIDSYGGGVFASYAPSPTGLRLLGALAANQLDLDVTRATMNGVNALATSKGSTDGHSLGALASIGWGFAVTDAMQIRPFADLQWSKVQLGAYAEQGGPFPIAYQSQTLNETISRLGTEIRWALTRDFEVNGSAAWVHRLSGKADAIRARLIGLGDISSGSGTNWSGDWAEVSVGAIWRVTPDTRLSGSVTARIGESNRPNATTRLGIATSF